MDHFGMKRPNVISYLNHLLEANCIYRIHDEEGNVFYMINEFFKILGELALKNPSKNVVSKKHPETISKKFQSYNSRQNKMLLCIKAQGSITVKEYTSIAKVSANTARADLKLFQQKGKVKKIGKTKNTVYSYI